MLTRMLIFGIIVFLTACGYGGKKEDREPQKEKKKQATEKRASIEEIEAGIKRYIKEKTEEGEGYFHIEKGDSTLKLKLVRVHTEYLSNLGPQYHFACVDLAEVNGEVYDVDFFLRGKPGNMRVTETTVHKLNGRPFYTWEQAEDKTWHRVPVKNASIKLLGVIEGRDHFRFTYEVRLPEIKESGAMWLPLAGSDRFQNVKIISKEIPGQHREIKDKKYGNTVLYTELKPEDSKKTLKISYDVQRKEKKPYTEEGTNPDSYLSANPLIPVGGRFKKIAEEIFNERKVESDLTKARALYDYIIEKVKYQKAGKYGTGDANYACDSKRGNCTEFHSLFISMARSAGIPARFAIGSAIPSQRNEGGVNGYHCWAEFYAEGKWWPVDISEANKYSDLATYYFGHHPANRIELSRGRDLRLSPSPRSGAVKFLAYPVLEVDGKRVSPETIFSFKRNTQTTSEQS